MRTKTKTSVTLSAEAQALLTAMAASMGLKKSRVVEAALWHYDGWLRGVARGACSKGDETRQEAPGPRGRKSS